VTDPFAAMRTAYRRLFEGVCRAAAENLGCNSEVKRLFELVDRAEHSWVRKVMADSEAWKVNHWYLNDCAPEPESEEQVGPVYASSLALRANSD